MAFQGSLPRHRPRLKSRACRTAAFGKLFLKRFGRIILRFAVFWPTLSWRFRKVCQSIGRVLANVAFQEKPRIPYPCIRKIVFKAFRTHHSSFCRVLANTFVAFQESLPKPRPRLKSRAFPTTAFGKLFLKRFGRIILRFAVFWPTLSWRFRKVCQSLGRGLKSRAFPTTAFGKLLLKRFGRIILRFAVFWPTLSWRFKKVCQSLGRVSKAAHSLPLHSENCF